MTSILVLASSYARLQVFVYDLKPLVAALGGTMNSSQQKVSFPEHGVTVYLGFAIRAGDEMRYAGRAYDYLHIVGDVDPELVRRLKPWIGRHAVVTA